MQILSIVADIPLGMPFQLKGWNAVLFAAVLLPSGIIALLFSDMPGFGSFHDDSLYFVGAKSLNEGNGYRIESLPGEPPQTKYPPLFPAILSLAWRISPNFPANLTVATAICWLLVPPLLVLSLVSFRAWGFSSGIAWALTAVIAVNPLTALFGSNPYSELLYTSLVLGFALLCDKAAFSEKWVGWTLGAGAVASLGYLTRTTAIALIPAAVIAFAVSKQLKRGLAVGAILLPTIGAWTIWMRWNMTASSDPEWVYYTDYFGYQFHMVRTAADFVVVLWRNVDALLVGMGSLLLPNAAASFPLKTLAQTIAIGMILGCMRMAREQPRTRLFGIFAVVSAGILVCWHFPPNERFVFPLFPLLLAGLYSEIARVARTIASARKSSDRGQRIAACGLAGAGVCVLIGCVMAQLVVLCRLLPEEGLEHRRARNDSGAAHSWIRSHVSMEESVLAFHDPVLYLTTNRHAMRMTMPPRYWYRQDQDFVRSYMSNIADFAGRHGLTYVLLTDHDIEPDVTNSGEKREIRDMVRGDPRLERVFHSPAATIYRVSTKD